MWGCLQSRVLAVLCLFMLLNDHQRRFYEKWPFFDTLGTEGGDNSLDDIFLGFKKKDLEKHILIFNMKKGFLLNLNCENLTLL